MYAVAWSPDQKLVLGGGGFNGRLHLWDTETGALLLTTQGHTQVFDVDWSPDGGAFVAASHYGWVEVWMIR
jgi:WD40 repeat protein